MGCGSSTDTGPPPAREYSGDSSGQGKAKAGKKPGKKGGGAADRTIEEVHEALVEETGGKPRISINSFENWGENVKREKILECEPSSLQEIQVDLMEIIYALRG